MSQIFQKKLKGEILFDFLNENCIKQKNYYTLDFYCYKKAFLNNNVDIFLKSIEPLYYKSKVFYIKRKMNYKRFSTIIRQICKHLLIPFTSKIKYYNSEYEIKYFIYPMIKV
jgi:hypothetical protein